MCPSCSRLKSLTPDRHPLPLCLASTQPKPIPRDTHVKCTISEPNCELLKLSARPSLARIRIVCFVSSGAESVIHQFRASLGWILITAVGYSTEWVTSGLAHERPGSAVLKRELKRLRILLQDIPALSEWFEKCFQ